MDNNKITKHQVSVAAESFATASFARAGYNVFVQYGPNQPGYDLVVSHEKKVLHVSVKGSMDPKGWVISTKKKDMTYEASLKEWYKNNKDWFFYLVLFKKNEIDSMPEMYITSAKELYDHLNKGFFGAPCLTLYHDYCPKQGKNKGEVQKLPSDWNFSKKRIEKYFKEA
jgi:hypothetical protein